VLELNKFAEICNMFKNKTDKDLEYLQDEKYKILITRKNNLSDDNDLQDDLIEVKQIEIYQHLKHKFI